MSESEDLSKAPAGDLDLKSLVRNYISLIGLALAVVALANIVFLFLIDVMSAHPSPYIGVLAYMVAPGFFILGLLLVPVGMWMERKKRAGRAAKGFPLLDLNNPSQR